MSSSTSLCWKVRTRSTSSSLRKSIEVKMEASCRRNTTPIKPAYTASRILRDQRSTFFTESFFHLFLDAAATNPKMEKKKSMTPMAMMRWGTVAKFSEKSQRLGRRGKLTQSSSWSSSPGKKIEVDKDAAKVEHGRGGAQQQQVESPQKWLIGAHLPNHSDVTDMKSGQLESLKHTSRPN